MTLQTLDLVVLVLYVAGVIGFGCWFVRKSGTTSEFMTAAGSIPGWAVGLSIFGTYLSSNTFLGVPGKAYGANWNAFVFSLSIPLAAWVAVRYFVPFYRGSGTVSAYEHFEQRFGSWARVYAVLCYVLTQIGRTGAILVGVSLGLTALTGWDPVAIVIATGILVTLYTLLGGIEAVIWTDVVQSLVLCGGAVLVLLMLLFGGDAGPGEIVPTAWNAGKLSLGSLTLDPTASTIWVMLLYGVFINLTNFGIDQSYVQRYHTADSERAASRAVWLGALLYVPISLLFFLIGSVLYGYYEAAPEMQSEVRAAVFAERTAAGATEAKTPDELTDAEIGDKVLPHFIANKLPPGLAGLLIAAIFAAAMSSIDTSLNSSATVLLTDVYKRHVNRDSDEEHSMRVLRVATVLVGLIGTGIAVPLLSRKSILDAWWQIQGIFSGALLGLFLLGLLARHVKSRAAVVGVIAGVTVIAYLTLSPAIESLPKPYRNPLHTNLTIVVGTLTIFGVGVVVQPLFRSRSIESTDDTSA